jgi:enolase
MKIQKIKALEILDSRGRPTVLAKCYLETGHLGSASVPSGASTGRAEAVELRDGDLNRYGGLGCKKAVSNINTIINDAVSSKEFANQEEFDNFLLSLDGTSNKSNLGANVILACSIAFAKATALTLDKPLYEYFGSLISFSTFRLPRVTINLFSGGKHAGGQIPLQDLLIVPASAKTMDESLANVYAVYQAATKLIKDKYGMRALTADEGGLAPAFESVEQMLDDAIEAIRMAGFEPGKDICIALDVAASHFYTNGSYEIGNQLLDSTAMAEVIADWVEKYPIISVEDGLAEDDWEFWPILHDSIKQKALVLGDDLLCTQVNRIQKAIDTGSANSLLLKVNQCGSLTEAAAAYELAKSQGWQVTVSARSGETEDNWLADLAVGWSGDQIKVGSITQSERLAKYNRLLEIESESDFSLNPWPFGEIR